MTVTLFHAAYYVTLITYGVIVLVVGVAYAQLCWRALFPNKTRQPNA